MNDEERIRFFNEHYEFFRSLIAKRRSGWLATSIMEFEDLESIILDHIYRKLHLYDQALELDRWTNTVITNRILNVLRDNIYKNQRPCISGVLPGSPHSSYGNGCSHNLGGTCCAFTKSGQQDVSCPLYKIWHEKKYIKHAIATPLSLEAHSDEYHSQPSHLFNVEEYKPKVDALIIARLSKGDAKLYRLLYVKHYPIPRVMKLMGMKTTKGHKTPVQITKARNRFKKVFYEVVQQLDLPHHE